MHETIAARQKNEQRSQKTHKG